MSEKDNIRVAEEHVNAINAHDYARLSSLHGEGYQFQAPGMPGPVGEDAFQAYTQREWTAFPDEILQISQTIAEGDYVVLNCIATGTNDGPLTTPAGETLPATGRKVNLPASVTMKFKDGKIVREDVYFDVLMIRAQLGLTPGA